MNKKGLSEADIEAKFMTPAMLKAGWNELCIKAKEEHDTIIKNHVILLQLN